MSSLERYRKKISNKNRKLSEQKLLGCQKTNFLLCTHNIIQNTAKIYLMEIWNQSLDIDIPQKSHRQQTDRQNTDTARKLACGIIPLFGGTNEVTMIFSFSLKWETESSCSELRHKWEMMERRERRLLCQKKCNIVKKQYTQVGEWSSP